MQDLPSDLRLRAARLLVYRSLWHHPIGAAWLELVEVVARSQFQQLDESQRIDIPRDVARAYGAWFEALASEQCSWQDWMVEAIARADNPFSRAAVRQSWDAIPDSLKQAAGSDLHNLQQLLKGDEAIAAWAEALSGLSPEVWSDEQRERSAIADFL
ncbi:MAG: hypothetical protein AAFY15_10910, partial [Cyanobacteria bacterium J06648_11]